MCMLCVVPPNVIPSKDKLVNSALNNPHGFGFAIVIPHENRILVERSMNADKSIADFLEMRARYPEGYAMWHARWATHGKTDISNCHPFRMGRDNLTYLGHNGILSVLEDDKDHRSDTRIFAEDLLPSIGGVSSLDNPQVWNMLEDFTTGSKVCVLTLNPAAKQQMYLLHADKGWHDDSGVWWSNTTCELGATYYSSRKYDWWADDGMCGICDAAYLTHTKPKFCSNCLSCTTCYQDHRDCVCDRPTRSIHDVPLSYDTYPATQAWGGKYEY